MTRLVISNGRDSWKITNTHRWSIAERQIEDCREELRIMVKEQTGIEWSALLGAME